MRSDDGFRAAGMDGAVAGDDVVIANVTEPLRKMPLPDLFYCKVLTFRGGGAVEDYFGDAPAIRGYS